MIHVVKSQPEPPELTQARLTNGECSVALPQLQIDAHNKCYICESKGPTGIHVEHFIPHRGDLKLKYDWNNLQFSCYHCNTTKSDNYTPLLDCNDLAIPILDWLEFQFEPFPKPTVIIVARNTQDETINTQQLLNDVYTGKTIHKTMEAGNLRSQIADELDAFQDLLVSYSKKPKFRATLKPKIIEHLSPSSPYAAFKAWIVRKYPKLMAEFGFLISAL